ncbi:MAG: hypothetical protein F6K13_03780 [Okeania sp. SIO2B9]|nr:hypothetical protein [Okeania sp. SIO2B9]
MSAGQLLKQANQLKRAGKLDEAIASLIGIGRIARQSLFVTVSQIVLST